MALTLLDAQNLSDSKLSAQIIDEFRHDPLFDMMLFDNNAKAQGGKSLTYVYNRVTTMPTAEFREIGSDYTAQEAKTTQYTVTLKPFGGSFEVDRILQSDEKQIMDLIQFELSQKIKATRALFTDTFINGDSSDDENAFDGIDTALTSSNTEVTPSAAIDLSTSANITTNGNLFMDELDKMLSNLDGVPTALLVNRKLASVINGIARRSGYFSTNEVDSFGAPVTKYAGIPIITLGDKVGSTPSVETPIIPIDSTSKETSLYAVRIGLDGVHAISPEGNNIVSTYLPNMAEPGAVKKGEVEMISAIALKATRAAGVLRKIKVG
ncbi:MAG: major capsid protein [Monoglobales bacterium]